MLSRWSRWSPHRHAVFGWYGIFFWSQFHSSVCVLFVLKHELYVINQVEPFFHSSSKRVWPTADVLLCIHCQLLHFYFLLTGQIHSKDGRPFFVPPSSITFSISFSLAFTSEIEDRE